MEINRDSLDEFEEVLEIFDLSESVELPVLSEEDLLFRESIVKAFYEIAIRTGKPVYGFSKTDLEEKYSDIVEEFGTRGRDYLVPLDRSIKENNLKEIISRRKKNGEVKKSKSSKKIFRFVSDTEVRLRIHDFDTAMCEICTYFSNMRCSVLEHQVLPVQVCDAYSGTYFYDDSSDRKYIIEDLNGFIRGLISKQPAQSIVIKSLDAPVGMLLIMKDNIDHYFSITIGEFIEKTIEKHHWTQSEVDNISGFGGNSNEQ